MNQSLAFAGPTPAVLTTVPTVPLGADLLGPGRGLGPTPCTSSCECPYSDSTFLRGVCGPSLAIFLGIIEMVLRDSCDVAEPCRRARADAFARRGHQAFDYIVVGAGVAGSVVASRLSEDKGVSVLLLEAGPEEPLATLVPAFAVKSVGTYLDWGFATEGEKRACWSTGGRCPWPRGKMVAGTGGMQGMMYMRGHPVIYDTWERQGNPGWGYRDVLPYFKKAEGNREMHLVEPGFHSDKGPLAVQRFPHRPQLAEDLVRAGNELLGYESPPDLNGGNQTGFTIAQMMVYKGLRGSTARMYLRPSMGRPNLVVNTEALVSKVVIDAERGRATGVEFIDKNGVKQTVRAKREVVVCAGAVGSPQLLLLSGLGPTEELEAVGVTPVADLPVGRNLHNHVAATIHYVVDDLAGRSVADSESDDEDYYERDDDEVGPMSMAALHRFLQRRSGPLASTGLTQVTAFLASKYAENRVPDIQIFFDGFHAGCQSELQPALRCAPPNATHSRGDFYDVQVELDLDAAARSAARSTLRAHKSDVVVEGCPMTRRIAARPTATRTLSKGRLSLRSADPRDPPLIHGNYFAHERDLLVLVEGMKAAAKLAETKSLRKWGFKLDETPAKGCRHLPFASDQYWACVAQTHTGPEHHQAGSCRMGPAGDPAAVVDPELRVHGVPNLRVADASIMPIVPNSNTIAGIVMVAEKASDLIRSAWKRPSLLGVLTG
ncbi:glucose dehydrogenase [FAD, quinone]-like [Frankliniella occidentalis]|uniref:Glucose dehydrogenase [FAD, quinone]-like n=1 Tax=Frankliniella occidentalis TaxID=133901 RepID=A0A6J1TEM6_FRAOC|nr:glucose dehydrogenase [FAD, quinone]-like [Frankliniella occidentalis]